MSFSFKNTQEDQSNSQYVRPGIQEVDIKEIYYQPIGPNVKEGQKPENSTVEKGVFVLTTKDGASFNYDVLNPDSPEKAEKMMKRMMHFLSKTGKSSEVEALKAKIQTIEAKDFKELIDIFSKRFTGKSVRIKFVATERSGKYYTSVPNFLSGWAESVDVNPSKLIWDEAKDGMPKKDSSKTESTEAGTNNSLPWD
jgi:hypothetical protein